MSATPSHTVLLRRRTAGALALALGLVMSVAGCVIQETTHTVNGVEVTDGPPPAETDVDPCTAVSDETLEALALSDVEGYLLTDPTDPGCKWAANEVLDADLTLWVTTPDEVKESGSPAEIDGVETTVWSVSDTAARMLIPCGPIGLIVNVDTGRNTPIDAETGMNAATSDVIAAYGCADAR